MHNCPDCDAPCSCDGDRFFNAPDSQEVEDCIHDCESSKKPPTPDVDFETALCDKIENVVDASTSPANNASHYHDAHGALIEFVNSALTRAREEERTACAEIAAAFDTHETAHLRDEGVRIVYDQDKYSYRIAEAIRARSNPPETPPDES